jgi:hypothetical protein
MSLIRATATVIASDPTRMGCLLPRFDSGDCRRPNHVGYRAMGKANPRHPFGGTYPSGPPRR